MIQPDDMMAVPCDLCGSEENDCLFIKEGFPHVRCRRCGLVFVTPRLKAHLEAQRSSGTGTMGDERLTAAKERRLQKEVRALEPHRVLNRLLEVGAGRGWFLRAAGRSGWETWAVEVNDQALEHLAGQSIHRIIVQPAEDFETPSESFDVVRMWDVIEHLQSPRRAVTIAHGVLRRGGLLQLATTNFASLSRWVNGPDWVYLNGADHIYLFEPESITRMLREAGFTDICIRTRSFNLRRKRYHPELELPSTRSILKPFRKIVDALVGFTPYGHQMIVTAVKT